MKPFDAIRDLGGNLKGGKYVAQKTISFIVKILQRRPSRIPMYGIEQP